MNFKYAPKLRMLSQSVWLSSSCPVFGVDKDLIAGDVLVVHQGAPRLLALLKGAAHGLNMRLGPEVLDWWS